MQTKQDIQKLLAGAATSPNHRLGQNFLIDLNLMRFLLDAASITERDVILEVGTGTGSLTEELAVRSGHVITVEYDDVLYAIAEKQLEIFDNVIQFNMDVLENKNTIHAEVLDAIEKAHQEYGGRVMLVANLPYNVGSCVMANLITGMTTADAMVVTVQKEVAERVAAAPGHDAYGTLSILMAATGNVHLLRRLPASVFWPRPQVESAIIRFQRNPARAAEIHDIPTFRQVIALFMSHRRKMLKACTKFTEGSLEHIRHWSDIFDEAFVDPHKRPEEITPKQYINIANLCYEQVRK